MEKKGNIASKFNQWKEKHKLSLTNDSTYHDIWSFRLSKLNIVSLFVLYAIIIISITFLLIRFTSLKSLFVDNTNLYELNLSLAKNTEVIDSLQHKIATNDSYLNDLKKILKGEDFTDSIENSTPTLVDNYQPVFEDSEADSILRDKIESEPRTMQNSILSDAKSVGFFMNPVKGRISKSIDLSEKHYGVDIVTQKDEPIKVTLEGVVLFSNWTSTEGNVIIVQHHNNFISAYKHCSVLLKNMGDKVDVGDPIAIVGNSGKYTDGPHLHFEIWQNGTVLNPQEFISF